MKLTLIIVLLCVFAPLRELTAQRIALKQLQRYLGDTIPMRHGYVGVTDTLGDQRYLKLDSIVVAILDTLISDSLEITDNDKQKIDTFYLDGMDSLKIKIENNTRTWSVYLGDLFSATGSDKQRIDTAVVIGNILYLSLQRDSVAAVQITLPTYTDTDTDSQTLYISHIDTIGINRGNRIFIRENQYPDTFTIVSHMLRLSIKDDGMPYYYVDLSPYVNVTQVYAHSGTTTYQNTLSGGGGSFLLQASGATTISHNGTGTVTISSTDNDNYIDSLFFTDGTDTLRIGRTGSLPDIKVKIPDDFADSLTWNKTSRILYLGRTGSLATLSDTLDGIVDSQRVIIFRRSNDTVYLQITNDTTRYFTLPETDTQRVNLFTVSNDTLRIRIDNDTTRFVKLSDTDHQYFDTAYILNDTLYLSMIRDLVAVYKFDLKPYVNVTYTWGLNATNDAWGATTVTNGTTMTLDGINGIKTQTLSNGSTTMTIDGQRLQWNLAANTGTTRLIGDWASAAETVNIRGTGIVTTRTGFDGFGSDSIIISATEVDASITNEIQLIDTFTIVNHILRNSLSQDDEAFKSVDLSSYMQAIDTFTLVGSTLRLSITGDNQAFKSVELSGFTDTDDQYADTFDIVSNVLRLSIDGDGQGYKSVNLSPYLDNTDNQYADTFSLVGTVLRLSIFGDGQSYRSVDLSSISGAGDTDDQYADTFAIVSNVLRLSIDGDARAFNSVNLSPYLDNTDNQTIDTFTLVGNTIRLSVSGDAQAFKSIDLGSYAAQTWGNSGTTSWTGTLSGGGGSTTMVTNTGISLSHSAGTVTWSVVDQSITNEAQNWNNTGGTNTYTGTLGQANGAGGGSITIVGAGQTTVSLSAGTLTINTPVLTDNDNYVDAVSFNNGIRTLTIGRTGILSDLTVVIPDADTDTDAQNLSWQSISSVKAIQAISGGIADTILTNAVSGIVFSQVGASLFLKAVDSSFNNEGIFGVGAGSSTSSTLISNTQTSNAVTINVAGITTITESTSTNGGSITLTSTEVDGSITNELEYWLPYIVSGDTLGVIQTLTNDTLSFYSDTGGIGGGGGGGATYTFSHTGGTSLVSTLNPSAGSISITPGTQIEVVGTASGINGIAKIKTNFNGCQTCVGFFGNTAGFTNDSIHTDVLFKYYFDETVFTLEAPTVVLSQTNGYQNPVALYIAATGDERVYTSGVDASGFNSGTFYHRVAAAGTISLPGGHTGPTTHYFINDGYDFNIARSGSETIDGGLSTQSFLANQKLVIVSNDGSGKWYTNKTAAGGSSSNIGHYFVPGSPQTISTTALTDITNSTTPTIPVGIYRVKAIIRASAWTDTDGYTLALATASGTAYIITGTWSVHDCIGTTITLDQETMGIATINSDIGCFSRNHIVGEFDINVTVAATLKLRLGVEANGRSANIWYGSLTLIKI